MEGWRQPLPLSKRGSSFLGDPRIAWPFGSKGEETYYSHGSAARFGEFGIRGVGYEVDELAEHLNALLGLDHQHAMLIVGLGNLGSALAQYLGFNYGSFHVVAGVDNDPKKIGRKVGSFVVRSSDELAEVVRESGAEIGVLAVPAEAAQENYDRLADAGIKAVLNFAPVRVKRRTGVPLKNVDLRINLEELAFFLRE